MQLHVESIGMGIDSAITIISNFVRDMLRNYRYQAKLYSKYLKKYKLKFSI